MDVMIPNMDGYAACSAIKNDPELKNPGGDAHLFGFPTQQRAGCKVGCR
jgi:CheY-like chemotaxis protein